MCCQGESALNTQTHVLLALTVLSAQPLARPQISASAKWVAAIVVGALLPDISLFVMWFYAKLTAVPEAYIWSEMYYSVHWTQFRAISNSFPVYFLLLVIAWWLGGRTKVCTHNAPASYLLVICLAALLHISFDLPLHHDDGHPHFWPFTDWIFSSPVSYWDIAHHAAIWRPIELAIAVVSVLVLWRHFLSIAARSCLVLSMLSYLLMAAYWSFSFS